MKKEELGDTSTGKDTIVINGGGMHIHMTQSVFDCPVCTCENDIGEKLDKTDNPVFNVKCSGCKRKLQIFSDPFTGKLTATEIKKK